MFFLLLHVFRLQRWTVDIVYQVGLTSYPDVSTCLGPTKRRDPGRRLEVSVRGWEPTWPS